MRLCFVNRKKVGIFAVRFEETITIIIFGSVTRVPCGQQLKNRTDEKNIPTFEQKKKKQARIPHSYGIC